MTCGRDPPLLLVVKCKVIGMGKFCRLLFLIHVIFCKLRSECDIYRRGTLLINRILLGMQIMNLHLVGYPCATGNQRIRLISSLMRIQIPPLEVVNKHARGNGRIALQFIFVRIVLLNR